MTGAETGVMTSNSRVEPFNVGHQRSSITPSPSLIQHLRLASSTENSAVYKPVSISTNTAINNSPSFQPASTGAGGGSGSAAGTLPPHGINVNPGGGAEAVKRKRGRPRKYGPDGSMAVALVQPAQPVPQPQQQQQLPSGGGGNGGSGDGGFLSPTSPPPAVVAVVAGGGGGATVAALPSGGPAPTSPGLTKKARGRPPGSTNKKKHVTPLGPVPVEFGFRPHILTVKAGEDVSSQIMAFSQRGPRSICVLSATGSISNVTIRQASTSGGTVTYEGKFEILSLTGSFTPFENGGQWSRTGGLQVALSGSDGRILGGGVAGVLIAATPIQLVVGSFIAADPEKQEKPYNNGMEPATAIGRLVPGGDPSSPASRGTLSESSGGPGSPIHQNSGPFNNSGISSMSWK